MYTFVPYSLLNLVLAKHVREAAPKTDAFHFASKSNLCLALNLAGRTKYVSGELQGMAHQWLTSPPFLYPAAALGQRTCWLQCQMERLFKSS